MNMKQYEEVFLGLVRNALWKTPPEIPEGFSEWGAVMSLAQAQAMTGLVGDALLRNTDILSVLPPKLVTRLQNVPLEHVGMHTVLNNTLIMVVTHLRAHGIEPVLLKGQGLARYYPVPQLRQCGDIDLYVGEDNYEKTYEALAPVVTTIDDRDVLKVGKHFHAKVGAVLLEIHRFADVHLSSELNVVFQKFADEGLTRNLVPMDFGGVSVNTPADGFNAYFVFNHLWHHFMTEGVGLRQICDWMMFLHTHRGTLSPEYIESVLNGMHLRKPWQSFGCLCVQMLGLPVEDMPLYDSSMSRKAGHILKTILAEGNFGNQTAYVRNHNGGYLKEKLFSFSCHVRRYSRMFVLFPSHALRWFMYIMKCGFQQVLRDICFRKR